MFRGATVTQLGLLTKSQLRSAAWRPLLRGIYADSRMTVDHRLRCYAAKLALPSEAVLVNRSALWMFGVEHARPEDPVEVAVPPARRVRNRTGIRVLQATIPPEDIVVINELRVTSAERTAWDLAHGPDLVEAIVMLDAMAARRLVSQEQLTKRLGTRRTRARRAIELMDGRVESPPESRLRVHLILAGLPVPTPQFDIFHNGQRIARVDLAWPDAKLAVEYDGEWHNDRVQFRKDRRRLNALTKAGWTVLFVTADTLRDVPALVGEVRAVLESKS